MKKEEKIKMQTLTRKIQIIPVGDKEEINRVYKYLRDGMYAQNRAYNILFSHLYAAIYSGAPKEEIYDIYKRGQRNPKEDDPEYSLYPYGDVVFPKGLPTAASVKMAVQQNLDKSKKDGLFKGKVSIPNKKLDAPLLVPSANFQFFYEYENYQEFIDLLMNGKVEVFMKFVNGIVFKVVFGNPYQSHEMRCVFQNIFEDNYKVQGSSIQFDRTGKKIILNLSLGIPKKEKPDLDEETVVGVKLGMDIPAICTLNNNDKAKELIGSMEDFVAIRVQMQEQRKRLQQSLKYASGGHGRKKKLAALDRYSDREKNFAKTYNHMVSRRIVDFALKNNAKYINLENIQKEGLSDFVLRNWSYYQLEQFITYKSGVYGIEVRKVNPEQVEDEEMEECDDSEKQIKRDIYRSRCIALSNNFI